MKIFLLVSICLGLYSCVEEVEISIPGISSQIALNGLLHPDSSITISLTKTTAIKDTTKQFGVIDNALVIVFENGVLLDTLVHQAAGVYRLETYPLPNRKYTVNAQIPGYPTISASDTVPLKPTVDACYARFTSSLNDNYVDVVTTIEGVQSNYNQYWLALTIQDYFRIQDAGLAYDSSQTYEEKIPYLLSNTPLGDNFNATLDYSFQRYGYRDYLRIKPFESTLPIDIMVGFTDDFYRYKRMPQLTSDQRLEVHIIAASQEFDRYFKSSILSYLNNDAAEGPNLFSEQVKVYSNIENGIGIFAAYNTATVDVSSKPCNL